MVDDSDAVTVDSWGAHTTLTSTTIGTAMTIGLVPVIDFSDTDGGAPKKWRCPRCPDNIFDDRNATCPDCEKEFQLHRIELKERRASVQQKLQDIDNNIRGDDSSDLAQSASDILSNLQASMKQWRPMQESGQQQQQGNDGGGASPPSKTTSPPAKPNGGSAVQAAVAAFNGRASTNDGQESPNTNNKTATPSGAVPPDQAAAAAAMMSPPGGGMGPSPGALPNLFAIPGAPGGAAPFSPPPGPSSGGFFPGMGMGGGGSFDALAMQIQRMQQMQDWMLWQKETECQQLRQRVEETASQVQSLKVENALLQEKLQQQEQRMQHELKLIKLAALQQRSSKHSNGHVHSPSSVEQQKEIINDALLSSLSTQQNQQPKENSNDSQLQHNDFFNQNGGDFGSQPQQKQATGGGDSAADSAFLGSCTSTGNDTRSGIDTKSLADSTTAKSVADSTTAKSLADSTTVDSEERKDDFDANSITWPSTASAHSKTHKRSSSGGSNHYKRKVGPLTAAAAQAQNQHRGGEPMRAADQSLSPPLNFSGKNAKSNADDSAQQSPEKSADKETEKELPIKFTNGVRNRNNNAPWRQQTTDPLTRTSDEEDSYEMVDDTESSPVTDTNNNDITLNNEGGLPPTFPTTKNAQEQKDVKVSPPSTSESANGSNDSFNDSNNVNNNRGVSFVDDNASMGQTVASSTYGEDRQKVSNQTILDPYGDKGNYTGIILRSTRMPHGSGRMLYHEDQRTYDGEWRHGRWHGFGRATFANGDHYEGEYRFDQRHGRGRYQWNDGRVYDGLFREDKRHGHGKFTWPDGAEYEGEFRNGQREGHGMYKFNDGGRYEGSWKNGRYSGFGICSWQDGRCYKGEWLNGMAHGKGTETFADGSIRHDGQWVEDEPVIA